MHNSSWNFFFGSLSVFIFINHFHDDVSLFRANSDRDSEQMENFIEEVGKLFSIQVPRIISIVFLEDSIHSFSHNAVRNFRHLSHKIIITQFFNQIIQ